MLWAGEVHPILRRAQEKFQRVQFECFPGQVPPDLVHIGASEHIRIGDIIFTARLADGYRFRWRGGPYLEFMSGPAAIRSPRQCFEAMRELWNTARDYVVMEARSPSMIVPPSPEALRDEFMGPFMRAFGAPPAPPVPLPCDCLMCQEGRLSKSARLAAQTKSLDLLKEWLSPAQRAQYEKDKHFDVTGSAGGRYMITLGTVSNVLRYGDSGEIVVACLCFRPGGAPGQFVGDTMLAQKIVLENDEASTLQAANVNDGWPFPIRVERLKIASGESRELLP